MPVIRDKPRLPRSPSDVPSNREMINKIDNDITLLRGEVCELRELIKRLIREKDSGWFFSK